MSTWCFRNMLKLYSRIFHSLHYVKKRGSSCHNKHMLTFCTHSYFVFKRINANIISTHLLKLCLFALYRLCVHQCDLFPNASTMKWMANKLLRSLHVDQSHKTWHRVLCVGHHEWTKTTPTPVVLWKCFTQRNNKWHGIAIGDGCNHISMPVVTWSHRGEAAYSKSQLKCLQRKCT